MTEKYQAEVFSVSTGYVVRVTKWRVEERGFLSAVKDSSYTWTETAHVLSHCVHKTKEEAENAARDYNVIVGELDAIRTGG